MSLVPAVSIGDSLQQGFDQFFAFLPNLVGFLVILLIGYVIARIFKTVVNKLLDRVGVDRRLHETPAGQYVERIAPDNRPSHLIGSTVFWFVFLFALSAAIGALRIPALTTFLAEVQSYLPNVIAAVLIFVVAAALASGVAGVVQKAMGDTPTGKLVSAIVPGVILAIGLFMVLDQLQIAPQIVTITYAGLIALLVLAGGLAFGLGGRDAAAQLLGQAQAAGQQATQQAKQDAQLGRQRAGQTNDPTTGGARRI